MTFKHLNTGVLTKVPLDRSQKVFPRIKFYVFGVTGLLPRVTARTGNTGLVVCFMLGAKATCNLEENFPLT